MLNNQTHKNMEISSKNQVLNAVLGQLNGKIEEMVAKIVAIENKKIAERNGRLLSQYAIDSIRISLVYDLVKSIETYTMVSDLLKSINHAYVGGSIEIYATIIRDGAEYNFATNVIEAGGYNIQCFHYRYITKTNLPKTGNSELTTTIKTEIKRLSKIERLESEIKSLQNNINHYNERIAELSKSTDQELMESSYFFNLTWAEIVSRGADVNYSTGQIGFNEMRENDMKRMIERNNNDINWLKRCIKNCEVTIKKQELKIETIAN
jgi:uncharacterized protein (UPF0335 family)